MIVGANVNPPPQMILNDEIIERVFVYKLLRVLIDTNLKWDNQIDSICSKASSRLHFHMSVVPLLVSIFLRILTIISIHSVYNLVCVFCFTHRLELLRLQKDLFQSRIRCKKLSDELTTPLNVHRWRQLEVLSFCLKVQVLES